MARGWFKVAFWERVLAGESLIPLVISPGAILAGGAGQIQDISNSITLNKANLTLLCFLSSEVQRRLFVAQSRGPCLGIGYLGAKEI